MKPLLAVLLLSLLSAATAQRASMDAAQMSIEQARTKAYPGSPLKVEQTLRAGVNYRRYVVSYLSEGLKIYALLTVPQGASPKGGWPALVFNHGYIAPNVYRTTERYVAYQDAFARNGFVTLKSDYRGHGNSQGQALGAYYTPGYTNDVMNALASLKQDRRVNAGRIGMWGHSMGGFLTLRAMAIAPQDVKAGVIWGGVVGDYDEMMTQWTRTSRTPLNLPPWVMQTRLQATEKYGLPAANPQFWNKLSANNYLRDIKGPLQLHIGSADEEVPVLFHESLTKGLKAAGKSVENYVYPNDNHNLSKHLTTALNRSVAFFKKNL